MEQYVKKGISKSNGLEEVMERRQNEKITELENIKLEAMIAEEKKKLQAASPATIDPSQATNFATMIFAGRSPVEIKQILSTLTQEEIDRFAYMASSMNPNNFANFRGAIQAPGSNVKEIVEIIKLILAMQQPANNGVDMKGIAEIFKAGVDAARVQQQPASSQNDPQFVLLKESIAESKAAREENARQREEMARQNQLRLEKDIADLKNRPSEVDMLLNYEERAGKLKKVYGGNDSATTNEFTLKKAEMDQTERLETRKLDWEEKKWEKEQESQGKTLEQVKGIIQTVGEGPIGDVIKMFGQKGAEKIRGSGTPSSNAPSAQIAKVKCPNCTGDFPANIQLPQIQCPLCGVLLQNGNQPAHEQAEHNQAQEQQASNPAQAQPSQNTAQEKPADQTVEVESIAEQPAQQ